MQEEKAQLVGGIRGSEASVPLSDDHILGKVSKVLFSSSLRRPLGVLTLVAVDALALLVGLVLAGYLTGSQGRAVEVAHLAPLLLAVWLAIFAAHGLYGRAQSRRVPGALLGAILWNMILLSVGSVVYPQSGFSLEEIMLGIFCTTILSVGLRLLYEWGSKLVFQQGVGRIPTLVIGGEEERGRVRQAMEKGSVAYSCVGELNVNGRGIDLPLLRRLLNQTGGRNVVLAGTERISDVELVDFLRSMWLRRVRVQVIPNATALIGSRPMVSQDMGVPLLEIGYPRLNKTQWILKRLLDIAGSLGGLVALSPLLIGVAILIKLTSPGPVLFRQKRVGADEKVFNCYKFRSMYEDAERRQVELEAKNEADGALFKIKNDPRITPIGRFIRRCSIDELPQLVNVLKGEMSLVGPRPLPLRDFELMSEVHKKRLGTVPGITGYWQISGRSDCSFENMVQLDLYYIDNWSIALDLKIILKTLRVVLRCDGAY
jgi:exopolysaccharide biosynthesis polyprenyl glycosylphosphotransferase